MIELKEYNYIDVDLMRAACHPVALELFDSPTDPMSAFNESNEALLDSALNNPRRSFDGKDLYPSLEEKAAILYYGLIKNHPFSNGNKRTATAALLVFLTINGCWISDNDKGVNEYLFRLAIEVASSQGSTEKDAFIKKISGWLNEKIYFEEVVD